MVRANERLSVLSAEAPIHQPLATDGSAFFALQEEMRNAFESTVLDLPRHMLIQHPHLVHEFLTALLEQRDPMPNAVQSANWTCVGLCAHQSALSGGRIVKLPEFTLE